MVRGGTISEHEFSLLRFSDTVDDAFLQVRTVLEQYHMKIDNDYS